MMAARASSPVRANLTAAAEAVIFILLNRSTEGAAPPKSPALSQKTRQ